MFSRDLRDAVAGGEITVSIRLWSRPKVKPGGRYATAGVVIEIDSVDPWSTGSNFTSCDDGRHARRPRGWFQAGVPGPASALRMSAAWE